ncbi:hypothetical protein [Pseudonocardia lacus]|uniref:hypothetical protein n=1 Tax=Pseudonocardia lacus TaxID=2835865 RepID=UPI001BDCEC33|nr:hypothetical protein [Pseudonocardia lacus]
MGGVVAAAVVEVDAADERHLVAGVAGVAGVAADDHQLLVVAPQRADPLVEQHLSARGGDGAGEGPVPLQLVAEHRHRCSAARTGFGEVVAGEQGGRRLCLTLGRVDGGHGGDVRPQPVQSVQSPR